MFERNKMLSWEKNSNQNKTKPKKKNPDRKTKTAKTKNKTCVHIRQRVRYINLTFYSTCTIVRGSSNSQNNTLFNQQDIKRRTNKN